MTTFPPAANTRLAQLIAEHKQKLALPRSLLRPVPSATRRCPRR